MFSEWSPLRSTPYPARFHTERVSRMIPASINIIFCLFPPSNFLRRVPRRPTVFRDIFLTWARYLGGFILIPSSPRKYRPDFFIGPDHKTWNFLNKITVIYMKKKAQVRKFIVIFKAFWTWFLMMSIKITCYYFFMLKNCNKRVKNTQKSCFLHFFCVEI